MKCRSDVWGEIEVEPVDEVYLRIQSDAEFMNINGNEVTLYYPCSQTKKEWLFWIGGKPYTNIGTNLLKELKPYQMMMNI